MRDYLNKSGKIRVNSVLSVKSTQNMVRYVLNEVVIFQHHIDDNRSFKMFASQLCVSGLCKQAEICRVFGISKSSVIRNVKKLKKDGPEAFYKAPKRNGREGTVITKAVQKKAEEFLLLGWTQQIVAEKLSINVSTLAKAVKQGRIYSRPIYSRPKDSKKLEKGRGSRDKNSNLIGNADYNGTHARKIFF